MSTERLASIAIFAEFYHPMSHCLYDHLCTHLCTREPLGLPRGNSDSQPPVPYSDSQEFSGLFWRMVSLIKTKLNLSGTLLSYI